MNTLAPNNGYGAQGAIECTQQGLRTTARLGACDLVTGTAVNWSGIYPERQTADLIKAEIGAARALAAKVFVMFHLDHFYDEHWRALKEVTSAIPTGSTAP